MLIDNAKSWIKDGCFLINREGWELKKMLVLKEEPDLLKFSWGDLRRFWQK